MKSERRHELEHNELADWTVNVAEKVKPYINVIVGGAIVVVLLAVAISLWGESKRRASSDAWGTYYDALSRQNPDLFQDVIELYPSSEAAQWATVSIGDIHLRNGCNELFSDKANANQELDLAIESYKAAKGSGNSLLSQQAYFGLARAYEAQGKLKEAIEAYKKLAKQKGGPYTEVAQDRITDLEKPSTLAFYDRFAKFEPKPDFSAEGAGTGAASSFESTDIPAPAEKASEDKPAEEEKKPAEEKKEEK